MLKPALIWLFFLTMALPALGQQVDIVRDSVEALSDTVYIKKGGKIYTVESYARRFQPRKALLYAAVLPGLGQIYNKKYWKLPLVYGGFAALTYYVIGYNDRYIKYKSELFGLISTPSIPPPSKYTETQLRSLVDTYRHQRDFFIILEGFMYILQMVDAHVDAHLKEFDLNPQLKVSLRPDVKSNPMIGRASGFTITIKF